MLIRNTDFMDIGEMEEELAELAKTQPEHARAHELRCTIGSRQAKGIFGPIRKAARR